MRSLTRDVHIRAEYFCINVAKKRSAGLHGCLFFCVSDVPTVFLTASLINRLAVTVPFSIAAQRIIYSEINADDHLHIFSWSFCG